MNAKLITRQTQGNGTEFLIQQKRPEIFIWADASENLDRLLEVLQFGYQNMNAAGTFQSEWMTTSVEHSGDRIHGELQGRHRQMRYNRIFKFVRKTNLVTKPTGCLSRKNMRRKALCRESRSWKIGTSDIESDPISTGSGSIYFRFTVLAIVYDNDRLLFEKISKFCFKRNGFPETSSLYLFTISTFSLVQICFNWVSTNWNEW